MKNFYLLFSVALLTASVAAATDFPTAEAFLGYNWVRFSPDTPNLPNFSLPSFNLHGGNAQLVYNFKSSIGLVLDVGAVHAGGVFSIGNNVGVNQPGVDHTLVNFVLGPRYTFHRHSRWMPFAQALFGGARATTAARVLRYCQGG